MIGNVNSSKHTLHIKSSLPKAYCIVIASFNIPVVYTVWREKKITMEHKALFHWTKLCKVSDNGMGLILTWLKRQVNINTINHLQIFFRRGWCNSTMTSCIGNSLSNKGMNLTRQLLPLTTRRQLSLICHQNRSYLIDCFKRLL